MDGGQCRAKLLTPWEKRHKVKARAPFQANSHLTELPTFCLAPFLLALHIVSIATSYGYLGGQLSWEQQKRY